MSSQRTRSTSGGWSGKYKGYEFYAFDWTGNVGPYEVVLQERQNWRMGYAVKSINLREDGDWEAELKAEQEAERKAKEAKEKERAEKKAMFEKSQWVGQPKQRLDFTLTLVNVYEYEGTAYSYYGSPMHYIYIFRDTDGNFIVWKTQKSVIDWYDEDADEWVEAELGSVIDMRATVKEHGTYKDTKQTIINRPKINGIRI